eukprot:3039025-Pyramimonas_sp.AAC.1
MCTWGALPSGVPTQSRSQSREVGEHIPGAGANRTRVESIYPERSRTHSIDMAPPVDGWLRASARTLQAALRAAASPLWLDPDTAELTV